MITSDQINTIMGSNVVESDGSKIGSAEQVYLDDATGEPAWVTVKTGFFGSNVSFVPLAEATWDGESVRVPYDKSQVKDAPNFEADASLSPQEESELYRHYGLSYGTTDTGYTTDTADYSTGTTEGYDTSGPTTDDAMTRSEEHLSVGTTQQEAGRVRLRKYVVTEQETATVPVTREEVRIEREPITEANIDAAMSGPDISEEEHEVVLHEERPVVSTETQPVERVRLTKDTVTDTETVTGEVRKEQVVIEDDTTTGTTGTTGTGTTNY